MPSRKTSKAGKKKPAAKKRAPTRAKAATRADLEKMLDQLRQIISAAETIIAGGARSGTRTSAVRSRTDTSRALGCLGTLLASQIVQDAAGGPHNIDKTLLEVGFINDNQRRVFQEDVFNGVLEAGCEINRGDIPNGANNTLREVRTAINAAAH